MQIKAAIFDFDGTIADSMPMWSCFAENFVAHLGGKAKKGLNKLVNPMSVQEAEIFLRNEYFPEMTLEQMVKATDEYVMARYKKGFDEKAGAGDFIRKMHARGVKMAIATATDREPVFLALSNLGLADYFEFIITCTDAGVGKSSSPKVFDMALERLGAKKEETLIFEDSFYAAKTAKAAGYTVCGVYDDFSQGKKQEMTELCDYYFDDFSKAGDELL